MDTIIFDLHFKNKSIACSALMRRRASLDCQQNISDVLAFGVKVLNISRRTIIESVYERQAYGLMTNDSVHLHTIANHRIPLSNLVTQDSDFAHIPTLTVWQPRDVIA
ncbi:MAG: type II toxin-antitoxin system VapC family toxin [Pyrinomonadaceae bacterium]